MTGCQADLDFALRHGLATPDRSAVVEPGVDDVFLEVLPQGGERARQVAFIGSWTRRKNPELVVRVITQVLLDVADARAVLMGIHGQQDAVLNQFPAAVRPRIEIPGRISQREIADRLRDSRAFFLPSIYEGFGMATAEAMACGCVAIVTPTGFGANLQSCDGAVVCDFRDETGMREGVRTALTHDAQWQVRSDAARVRVETSTWANQVRRLEEIYRQWTIPQGPTPSA